MLIPGCLISVYLLPACFSVTQLSGDSYIDCQYKHVGWFIGLFRHCLVELFGHFQTIGFWDLQKPEAPCHMLSIFWLLGAFRFWTSKNQYSKSAQKLKQTGLDLTRTLAIRIWKLGQSSTTYYSFGFQIVDYFSKFRYIDLVLLQIQMYGKIYIQVYQSDI